MSTASAVRRRTVVSGHGYKAVGDALFFVDHVPAMHSARQSRRERRMLQVELTFMYKHVLVFIRGVFFETVGDLDRMFGQKNREIVRGASKCKTFGGCEGK